MPTTLNVMLKSFPLGVVVFSPEFVKRSRLATPTASNLGSAAGH